MGACRLHDENLVNNRIQFVQLDLQDVSIKPKLLYLEYCIEAQLSSLACVEGGGGGYIYLNDVRNLCRTL